MTEELFKFIQMESEEKVIFEEFYNIYRNEPLFPGDSISHKSLRECINLKWAVRDSEGNVHTTKMGRDHYHSVCLRKIMNMNKTENLIK